MDTQDLDWSLEGTSIYGWTKKTNLVSAKSKFAIAVHSTIGSGVYEKDLEAVAAKICAALTLATTPASADAADNGWMGYDVELVEDAIEALRDSGEPGLALGVEAMKAHLEALMLNATPTPPAATAAPAAAGEAGEALDKERCRILLLHAMDDTLPKVGHTEPLMDGIARRMCHRAQFDEISRAMGLGPLIRGPLTSSETPAAPAAPEAGPVGGVGGAWVAVTSFDQIQDGDTLLIHGAIDLVKQHLFRNIQKKDTEMDGQEIILRRKGNVYFNFNRFLAGNSWVEACFRLPTL